MPGHGEWEVYSYIATVVVGLFTVVGAPAAVWRYFVERRRDREQREEELRWRRTEFLFGLSERFHRDSAISECVRRLEYRESYGTDLETILRVDGDGFSEDEIRSREQFNRFLSFLDDIYYLVLKGVFTRDEVGLFAFYVYLLDRNKFVLKYCDRMGFGNVLRLYQNIKSERIRAAESGPRAAEARRTDTPLAPARTVPDAPG